MDLFAEKCGISGPGIRYYIIKNGGFKLLFSDEDILEHALDQVKNREFHVYIEYDPPQPKEVAVESARIEKNAVEKKKNKGKQSKREKGKDKGKVTREDDIEVLGEVPVDEVGHIIEGVGFVEELAGKTHIPETGEVGMGDMDEDDMDDADFVGNDYGLDSVSGDDEYDDELYEILWMMLVLRWIVQMKQILNQVEMWWDDLLFKKRVQKAVQSYAIKQKRSVKFTKNDSFRVYAVCAGDGCQWKIHANKLKNEETFQINLYQYEHTCPQVFNVSNVKTSWLSEKYLQDFKSDPKRDVKGWRVDIMNQLRCHVSRDQAYRAKRQALKKVEGSHEHKFSKLWDYAEESRRTNPGSTVILGVNDVNGENRHYQISCYDGSQFSVDLEMRTCSCRIWQLSGIPCKHACSAIFNQNLQPEDMVHPYYNIETYKQVYEPAILPISGETLWTETGFIPPLLPNFGRGPGRPPEQETGSLMSQMLRQQRKQQKVKHHCKICGEEGHNAKGCALWKDMQEPGIDEEEQRGASSSSNPRKRKHSIYQDPTKINMTAAASGVNDHPPILPPVTEESEPTEPELTPDVLTEAGPSQTQASVQGPSMYEQLQMGNTSQTQASVQPQMILQPRLNIRAPPPMTGTGVMPCFSSRPLVPVPKP
ncbi:UNVERIFIED_CONTAM: hypothetical protein Slati_3882400 [Sesamum latifolium]|uniref:SWIM-type domain-containing protein n=1 Tax=Sesamum latifolium TaxID=2727402 RepID=A0AAW2TL55_9LAMI